MSSLLERNAVSPPCPREVGAHTKTAGQSGGPAFVHRAFRNCSLRPDSRHYAVPIRLYDDAAYDHLRQRSVQRLEVEDEVQLAYILKQLIQSLDVDLYQIDQGERGLGRGGDDDEVEGRVVAVCHE